MKLRIAKLKALPLLAAAVGAMTCASAPARAAVNIVQNPGFESRNPTDSTINDWTVSPFPTSWFSTPGLGGGNPTPPPGGGSYFASTGCDLNTCDLSQTLTTTAGTKYSLSFLYNPGQGAVGTTSETKVYWDGTLIAGADFVGGVKKWSTYSFTGLVGTGSDTLTFEGFHEVAWNGLDNVSVTAPGPVPGAGLAGLAALMLAGLYASARRA
jgi:hypothetical protein